MRLRRSAWRSHTGQPQVRWPRAIAHAHTCASASAARRAKAGSVVEHASGNDKRTTSSTARSRTQPAKTRPRMTQL
jgi:hypothetical protein